MTAEHTPARAAVIDELQIWRARVLDVLLIVALVATTPRITESVIEAIRAPEWWPQTLPFVAIYLFLFILVVWRRLGFHLRVWGLAIIGYGYAVMSLVLFGKAGEGLLLLLALPLIGMLLIGNRSGMVMAGLSVSTYSLFTLFAYLGWLQDWLVVRENPITVTSWLRSGTVFTGILMMLVVMQWFFSRIQMQTLQQARQTAAQLAQAHDQLRAHSEALDRYAHLLEVGSLVSRETATMLDREEMLKHAVHLIAQHLGFDQVAVYLADDTGDRVEMAAAAYPQPVHGMTDLTTIKRVMQTGRQQGSRSPVDGQVHHELTLPLQVAGQMIGALDVHATRAVAFSEQEIVALQGMADLLALAMENARLFAETQDSLRELDALYRHYTAEAWRQFLGEQPTALRYESGQEVPDQTWEPLFAQARQTGQPVTGVSEGDPLYYLLALPVKLRQLPIGVLGFYRSAERGPWQAEDIAVIETVADRLALSLDNVRLLEAAQRRAARERRMTEITTQVRTLMDVDTILRTAIQELGRTLRAAEGTIWLEGGPRAARSPGGMAEGV